MTTHTIENATTQVAMALTDYIVERDRLVRQIAAMTGQSAANVMTTVRMATAGRPTTVAVLAELRSMLADAGEEGVETRDTNPF